MPLIIDTFNVLHTTGVLPPDLAGLDIEELRGVISLSRFRNQSITLVCDGVEPLDLRRRRDDEEVHVLKNISMIWSDTDSDADTLIEILVAQNSAPRRLTVITSDRRLTRVIRKRKVRVMTSESFLKQLSHDFRNSIEQSPTSRAGLAVRPPHAYEVPLHADSVRWWLQYLNLDPDHPAIEGDLIPPSSESSVSSSSKKSPDPSQTSTSPQIHHTEESDPVRWWLQYFGLNPDRLPQELQSLDESENG